MATVASERYELCEEIAAGGQGVVFRARDRILNRDVAVKVLKAEFATSAAVARRFLEEARITAQLQHPGIPPIHDLGSLPDGRPFLAMKLIRGRTLADVVESGRNLSQLLPVFEQICHALAYAHDRGVIHRDLKPANVMVGAFGEVQVMDWGLAKVLGETAPPDATVASPGETTAAATEIHSDRDESSHTRAGSVLGTPAYMPPEQAIGAIDQLDARSDVFGLGAILCALLTGKPPYVGADSESTRQLAARVKLDDAWSRLEACGAEPDLVALCKKCLAPEKADRPKDAGVVAKSVADLRTAAESRARQAELDRVRAEGDLRTAELKATELRRRRRVQLALAAAVILLLVAGGAFAWWSDHRATQKRFEDEQRAAVEHDRNERNAEAVAALLGQCEDALRGEDAERATLALDAAEKRAAEGGAEQHAQRLTRCKADLTLLKELDRIDDLPFILNDDKYTDAKQVNEERRKSLSDWGLVLDEISSKTLLERLASSLLKDRVIRELDEWAVMGGPLALGELLHAIDPDDYRDAMRAATLRRHDGDIATLSGKPAALQQPARFSAVLGKHYSIPQMRRRQILNAAIVRKPTDFTLLMSAGFLVEKIPEYASERELWFRSALMLRPRNIAANWSLAEALTDKKDHDGAIECYRNMIRIDPNRPATHAGLGAALFRRGDVPGAIESARFALRLAPDERIARNNLGRYLIEAGRTEEAIAELERVVQADPDYAMAYRNLGLARRKKGDFAGAINAYERSVLLEPDKPYGHFHLGELYFELKDYSGAVAAFRDAIRLDPRAMNYQRLGEALYGKGDLDKALQAFLEAAKRNPQSAWTCDWLAFVKLQTGDPAGALPFAEQSVKLDSTVAQFQLNLGRARLETGNVSGALNAFREAIRLDEKRDDAKQLLDFALKLERGLIAPPPREVKK